jgi:hypothetical protein
MKTLLIKMTLNLKVGTMKMLQILMTTLKISDKLIRIHKPLQQVYFNKCIYTVCIDEN